METMDLVASGLDVNITVTVTESFGVYPHDTHRRTVHVFVALCNQDHPMEVKQTVLVVKEVYLHPWDGGVQRDKTNPTFTFRLLQAPPDHIDYDAGQEMWVAGLVVQVQEGRCTRLTETSGARRTH